MLRGGWQARHASEDALFDERRLSVDTMQSEGEQLRYLYCSI